MQKSINALVLLVILSVIWRAQYGTQKETSPKENRESQSTSQIQNSLLSDSFVLRGYQARDGRNQKSIGSVGIESTAISGNIADDKTKVLPNRDVDRPHRGGGRSDDVSLGDFTVTAYTNSPGDTGKSPGNIGFGITASGAKTIAGITVATDWSVLPEGTIIEIEGLQGQYIVQDSGSAICGKHIDLFVSSEASAVEWGVKKRKVTVLK